MEATDILPPAPHGMTDEAWRALCEEQRAHNRKKRIREALAAPLPPMDEKLVYAVHEALVTAQKMADAIRAIIEPLYNSAEAYGVLCAVEACLDKLSSEADPAVDAYGAANATRVAASRASAEAL